MSGKWLIGGFLVFVAVFASALVYFRYYAWYRTVDDLTVIAVQGADLPVTEYHGIDGVSSPLKLRGCFRIDPAAVPQAPAPEATPLVAPGWFGCFDAGRIEADLKSGKARAVLAARDDPSGFDRYLAVYPDGRAYLWRQLNGKYVK